jgi:WD40 repeat protein
VNCVAFHPNGRTLATASDVWDVQTGEQIHIRERKAKRFGVSYHPQGEILAICGDAGVGLYNADTGQLLQTLEGHFGAVGAVTFSKSGKWLATASEDGTVLVWDVATGKPLGRMSTNTPANHVAISSDEKWLVASNRNGRQVRCLDLATMTDRGTIHESFDWIHAVAFHPSNEYFAVAARDGSIDFVELASGSVVRRVRGHDTRVWTVAFHPNGRQLVSAGAGVKSRHGTSRTAPITSSTGRAAFGAG